MPTHHYYSAFFFSHSTVSSLSLQKSGNISDPAEPACKRSKFSCSPAPDFSGFDEVDVEVDEEEEEDGGRRSKRHAEFCANCYSDKEGALLRCRDCRRSGKFYISFTLKMSNKVCSGTLTSLIP